MFVRDSSGMWTEQAVLSPPLPRASDHFGWSVAISGNTLVIGAYREDNLHQGINPGYTFGPSFHDSGAAYVYVRSGNTWSLQAYLKASDALQGDQFGHDVAIDGDTVVVGADFGDGTVSNSGTGYVFVRNGSTWSQQAILQAAAPAANERFGLSVDIDGDTAVIGAPYRSASGTSAGAAHFFVRNGSAWTGQGTYLGFPTDVGRLLGISVAVSGNRAVIGASGESSTSTGINGEENGTGSNGSGAAYILERTGGVWTKTAFFKASNAGAGAQFGSSVDLEGGTVLVGAPRERSSATGINGDQNNTSVLFAGAAYLFQLDAGQWSQTAYIKASNTRSSFQFGSSVTLHKGSMVIGAPGENSGTNQINGNQGDTSAAGAGAAYALKFQDPGPDLALENAAGNRLLSGEATVSFPVARVPLTILNQGLSPLAGPSGTGGVGLSITGPDASFFQLKTASLANALAPGARATFHVTFDPSGTAGTTRHATLVLSSNDDTPSSFTLALTGQALSATADVDGDGINDAAEFRLSPLGFDWQIAQPDLAAILFGSANGAGLYTESQVRGLHLPAPLISRNPATGRFELEIGVETSATLDEFSPFPITAGDVTVTPQGKIEFEFPGSGNAAFFRVTGR